MSLPRALQLPFEGTEQAFDAIIVGAGPAGLAAAIYLARANLKVIVLESEKPGGRLQDAKLIENYPGFRSVSGAKLAERIVNQVESLGAEIIYPARAIRFDFAGDTKAIWTHDKEYWAKSVLLAIGVQRKKVEIFGAREFLGAGVSYCPVCDGSFFRNQDVALIGDDEETISDGLYLSALVSRIHLIPGTLKPHYSLERLERLVAKGNVQIWQSYETTRVLGTRAVEKVKIRNLNSMEERELIVKGVFISGEKTPVTEMLSAAGLKTDSTGAGCIVVDDQMQTNISNVYAAGDAICGRKYQVSVSVGQGVTAALSMIRRHVETVKRQN